MDIKRRFLVSLSDRILLILFIFTTILFLLILFFFQDSLVNVIIVGAVVYILSFLSTYLISFYYTKRISRLTFKIEEIAAGNIGKLIEVRGRDEVAQLTHSLNELITRLKTGVAQDVSKHMGIQRAKTDFVAVASHQLRTPLSIIKWYVDFILSGDAGVLSDDQKRYLQEVYRSNERLIELVNALLDVSRIDVGTFSIEPQPVKVVKIAEEALRKFAKEIAKKNITIEKVFDDMPDINLDPRLTRIVFENILSNSVKYTPENGIIRVVIKKTEKEMLIKISDTGCGIPRPQQPKIFTKLFRADNVKKIESIGTGLGLYIVKAIVEKSGGKIWFHSPSFDLLLRDAGKNMTPIDKKKNKGTSFFITVPLRGMKYKRGTKKLES